jgi:hypothetical protein
MLHQDLLLVVLSDESRSRPGNLGRHPSRARRSWIPLCTWTPGIRRKVTFDRALLNQPTLLRLLDSHAHVAIVGPVGVSKTFLGHALGHTLFAIGLPRFPGGETRHPRD